MISRCELVSLRTTLSLLFLAAVLLGGALVGTRVLAKARTQSLKILFALVILVLAAEMIYNGITHKI